MGFEERCIVAKRHETKFLIGCLQVTISVVDKEAAKLAARINVSWGEGDCHVDLPSENVGDNLTRTSYSSLFTAPGTFALALGAVLVLVLILGMTSFTRSHSKVLVIC